MKKVSLILNDYHLVTELVTNVQTKWINNFILNKMLLANWVTLLGHLVWNGMNFDWFETKK